MAYTDKAPGSLVVFPPRRFRPCYRGCGSNSPGKKPLLQPVSVSRKNIPSARLQGPLFFFLMFGQSNTRGAFKISMSSHFGKNAARYSADDICGTAVACRCSLVFEEAAVSGAEDVSGVIGEGMAGSAQVVQSTRQQSHKICFVKGMHPSRSFACCAAGIIHWGHLIDLRKSTRLTVTVLKKTKPR